MTSVGGSCTTGDSPVSVTLDGNPTSPASATCSAGNWTLTLTTTLSGEATYTFAASQTDAATNSASTGNKQVTIDKTAPVVTLDAVNGIGGDVPVLDEPERDVRRRVVHHRRRLGQRDPQRQSGIACDGELLQAGSWTLTLTTPLSAEGAYMFSATQTDLAGNSGSSGNKTVTIDKTAPTVTINQAATQADPTSTAPIKFTVVFSEPVDGDVHERRRRRQREHGAAGR